MQRTVPEDPLSPDGRVSTERLKVGRDGQKNHNLCVVAPVLLEENTQTVHFHKPLKNQLNTTLPSPTLAQPWTLNLPSEPASNLILTF